LSVARARSGSFRSAALLRAPLLGALALLAGCNEPPGPGETWRRGFFGGEQLRLLPDSRYRWQSWSRLSADETIESGTWTRLGEVVSLVPSGSGRPPRILRITVAEGDRYLYEASADGTPPSRDEMLVRLD
jgi:hypothetical protein